jgi:outer membrane receptor protein involved in Fe transport
MTNYKLRSAVHNALVAGAVTSLVGAGQSALAQQTPAAQAQPSEGLGEIVVTGSRIAVPNLESISPVTSVTAADIALTGKMNVADVLNQLPQIFAAQGGMLSNASSGTAEVNLRNLGSARTLVLVDGRRLGPGDAVTGTNASDINQVPAQLVERIEVLTGGASSTYGADAAAGVVNFILKHNFEGVEVNIGYNFYNHHNKGGGPAEAVSDHNYPLPDSTVNAGFGRDASMILGINTPDGKGNAEFYVTYHRNDPALQAKYDYSACTLNGGTGWRDGGCSGSSTSYPGRFKNFDTQFNTLGNNTVGPGGTLIPFTNADRFNFGPLNYFLRPDERWTAGSFDHYEFNEHFDLYGQLMVMRDESVSQIAPSGAFYGTNPLDPLGNGGMLVNCNNPFLSAAQIASWCGPTSLTVPVTVPVKGVPTNVQAADLFLGRRNVEGGNRQQDLIHQNFRIVIGAKGDIGQGWKYDAYFSNALTDTTNTYTNDVSWIHMQNALLVGTDINGKIVCSQGTNCVPWNIFSPGQVPAGGNPYIGIPLLQQGHVIERVVHADVTGDLGQYGVQLPSAKNGLKINGGAEWREDILTFQPDLAYIEDQGAGQGGPILPTNGGYNVWEGFIEAHMPLIEDATYTKSLSFDAGYRYSSYNLGFNTNTYKFGLEWAPIADFSIRGSYNQAVRVPNIAELYTPQAIVLDGTIDPCAGAKPAFTQAQCAAQGVTRPGLYGNVAEAPASQYNGLTGGNTHLQPETAKTYSFGFSFTPTFLPDFRLQVDYWDIKIHNAINAAGADTIKLACGYTLDPATCGLIHRNPQLGTLWTFGTYVQDTTLNIGEVKTSGVDVDMSYRLDMHSAGRLDFALIGTYTKDYVFSPINGVSYDCAGLYGPVCNAVTTTGSGGTGPLNKWRHQFRTTYETPLQGLSFTATWRYYSDVTLDAYSTQKFLNNPGLQQATDQRFASRSYLDIAGAWRFAEKYTLRAGINNVLDKDPPLTGLNNCPTGQCSGNTWPQTYDVLGRYVFINLQADF